MPDISSLSLNTYGIRSINRETFNTRYHDNLYFPKELRDIVVTAGTSLAQITCGALEALVRFGWVANAVLDVVATRDIMFVRKRDANYPGPLEFLNNLTNS